MSLTRQNLQQIESKTIKFKNLGFSSNVSLNNILDSIDSDLDFPLKLSATFPSNNSKLNISGTTVVAPDGANKIISPIKKQIFSDIPDLWVDFQLKTVSHSDLFDLTWPTTNNIGSYRRLAISLNKFGKVSIVFSDEQLVLADLEDPSSLFPRESYPIGYIDLECNSSLGRFKTPGQVSNIISNETINRFESGGGASGSSFEGQLIDGEPVVAPDVGNLNAVYYNEITQRYEKANASNVSTRSAVGLYDAENNTVVFSGVVNFTHAELPYTNVYLSEDIDGGITLGTTSTILGHTLYFNKLFVSPTVSESTSGTITDPNGDKFLLLQPDLIKTLVLESEGGSKYSVLVSNDGVLSTEPTTELASSIFRTTKPNGTYAKIGVLDDGTLYTEDTSDLSILIDDFFYINSPDLNAWKFTIDDSGDIITKTHANNFYVSATPNNLLEVRQLVSGRGSVAFPNIQSFDLIEPQQTSPREGLTSFSVLKDNENENGVLVSFNNENIWSSVGSTVGDVKQSVLTEEQFLSLNGNAWALMDGRDVTGSVYHAITGNIVIPDMVTTGAFTRQATSGRAPGSYEADAMQGHKHRTSSAYVNSSLALYGGVSPADGTTFNHGDGTTNTFGHLTSTPSDSDGINGAPRVANETRPKNVAINFFIKIN
jgi:hypothetical protein